jgi:hypothetical protein
MAVQLNVQRILSAPFSPQPLALRSVADRAVALRTIFAVKLMTLFAVRLPRIERWYGRAVSQAVLASRDKLKVLWVHARAIFADVVDEQSFRNVSESQKPRHAVRPPVHSPKVEGSIPVTIKRALPHVAIDMLGPLALKTLDLGHGWLLIVDRKVAWSAREVQHGLV